MKLRAAASFSFFASALLMLPLPAAAASFCYSQSAGYPDEQAVRETRIAIDGECPCESFTSKGEYRRCAKNVVAARIYEGLLPEHCKKDARDHAWRSICGIPGAAVCCRTGGGRTRHRIVKTAADCVGTSTLAVCLSDQQSVATGCDADGCSGELCGNLEINPGEDCDPPDPGYCDESCHLPPVCGDGYVNGDEDCDPPNTGSCDAVCKESCTSEIPSTCGNGALDAGESCEPAGAGNCTIDCQTAACASAGAGEIEVACVAAASTEVAAAASASGYLLAWISDYRRGAEVLARRFDASGAPGGSSVSVVSEEHPCGAFSGDVSAASDGTDYYIVWFSNHPISELGYFRQYVHGRRFGSAAGAQTTDTIVDHMPIGSCRFMLDDLTSASGAGAARFAAGYHGYATCSGSPMFEDPSGVLMDFAGAPAQTDAHIGFPTPTGSFSQLSTGPVAMASLSGSTLWAWHASNPGLYVEAQWSDGLSTGSPFTLSSRQPASHGDSSPAVATGASSFLVAWGSGPTTSSMTEVRGLRVTRASGPVDPDGGLLLASVPDGVRESVAAAFDGTRWLVAWTEPDGMAYEIRAVAVNADGSVVDTTPRLIASNVSNEVPSLASRGDGKVLVLYTRPDAGSTAIRAQLVTP